MQALTASQIDEFCDSHPAWSLRDGRLVRKWRFPDFVAAMAFVGEVAKLAEEACHHPDIDIRYSMVELGLVTHDAGGITERDLAMATQIGEQFASA